MTGMVVVVVDGYVIQLRTADMLPSREGPPLAKVEG